MENRRINHFSSLGIALLIFSTVPLASATGLSMQYGCLAPDYNDAEYQREAGICNIIYNYYYWYGSNAPPVNCYWVTQL